ncbi:MAG: dihydrofolate reductase family protein [Paludibaculum sp.]
MSKVFFFKSMSLDGFIAGPNDEIDPLHDWLFTTKPAGKRESWEKAQGKTERFFGPEGINKDILMGAMAVQGASVVGRRTYDVANGWGGKPPGNGPYFVLTHKPPPKDAVSSAFTFVTDGIESAVRQAISASKSGQVDLMGANVIQQGFRAGLVDSIVVQVIPVLMGSGIRLFDHLGAEHIRLNRTRVAEGPGGVTHLFYDVVR